MARKLYDQLYIEAQVKLATLLQNEERQIIKTYGTALAEIRTELEKLYKKYAVDGKLTNGEMSRYNRLSGLQDQIQEILEKRMKQVDSMTRRLTAEQFEESFFRHAYAIDQAGGMSLEWGQLSEDAVEAAVNSTYSKLASSKAMRLSRTGTVEKVRQEIALSTIRGDSYTILSHRISETLGVRVVGKEVQYIDKGAAARSMMVARTEGQRVLAEGQAAATKKAKELGCDIFTVWDATMDGRTRPAHGALDGKPKDDPEKGWNVPGIGWVSAPLHSGIASFDINCRCRMRDQVNGYPPNQRYIRGDGIQPYQTYSEWKKSLELAEQEKLKLDIVTSDGTKISGFAKHAMDRMSERGVNKGDMEATLLNPLKVDNIKVDANGRKSQRYIGEHSTVNINPETGTVVTVWPTGKKLANKYKEGVNYKE